LTKLRRYDIIKSTNVNRIYANANQKVNLNYFIRFRGLDDENRNLDYTYIGFFSISFFKGCMAGKKNRRSYFRVSELRTPL
jgi:hypothetical protein